MTRTWTSPHGSWENEPRYYHACPIKHDSSSTPRSFSSPEAAILLVCARNRDLWSLPISEHAQSTRSVVFSQSDLLDFTMSPWIAEFPCWRRPEVSIPGADQKDRGLWGREYTSFRTPFSAICGERALFYMLFFLFFFILWAYESLCKHLMYFNVFRNGNKYVEKKSYFICLLIYLINR